MAFKSKRKSGKTYDSKSSEPFKISRSKIDLFHECPRCFYLDTRLGIKRPDTYPLTLNLAVDALLKKEFDLHRAKGVAHPTMKAYHIDAIPFQHKNIGTWRELDFGRGGIHFIHPETNLDVYGVVDDVWVTPQKELIVVDYKATAKKTTPTLEGDLGAQYKRQMEVYQWLLRKNGFTVSDTGCFFYVNGKKDAEAFDAKLEFDITILPCIGKTEWIDAILTEIKNALEGEGLPPVGEECQYCQYREEAGQKLREIHAKTKSKKTEGKDRKST